MGPATRSAAGRRSPVCAAAAAVAALIYIAKLFELRRRRSRRSRKQTEAANRLRKRPAQVITRPSAAAEMILIGGGARPLAPERPAAKASHNLNDDYGDQSVNFTHLISASRGCGLFCCGSFECSAGRGGGGGARNENSFISFGRRKRRRPASLFAAKRVDVFILVARLACATAAAANLSRPIDCRRAASASAAAAELAADVSRLNCNWRATLRKRPKGSAERLASLSNCL